MHEQRDIGEGDGAAGWDRGKHTVSPRLVAFVAIAIVSLVFVLQNREPTTIHFLFVEVTTRVWLAIVIAIALGILLDRLFLTWWRRRRTKE